MGITQRHASAVEHAKLSTTELSTLAAYVEALGGCLKIIVGFGDQQLAFTEPSAETATARHPSHTPRRTVNHTLCSRLTIRSRDYR